MKPIPFSERHPTDEDCKDGMCWYFHATPLNTGFWAVVDNSYELWDEHRRKLFKVTHWLPYDAFPNPNENGEIWGTPEQLAH